MVSSVAFSLDGKKVITGSWDSTARVCLHSFDDVLEFSPCILYFWQIWDPVSGGMLETLYFGCYVEEVRFSEDGQKVVALGFGSHCKVCIVLKLQKLSQSTCHFFRFFPTRTRCGHSPVNCCTKAPISQTSIFPSLEMIKVPLK